jgi:hypothetical protein
MFHLQSMICKYLLYFFKFTKIIFSHNTQIQSPYIHHFSFSFEFVGVSSNVLLLHFRQRGHLKAGISRASPEGIPAQAGTL